MVLKKFMITDMAILTTIAILTEWLGSKINKDLMYISLLPALMLVVLIRWKSFGLIPLFISALIRPLIYDYQGFNEYLLYSIPVLTLGLALIPLKLNWFSDINERRYMALVYYTSFYVIFFLTSGLLTLILISSEFSLMVDFVKYLLMLVIGNIIYYLFAGQKIMLIDISKTHQNYEGDRDNNAND